MSPRKPSQGVLAAVESAVAAMHWLAPSDTGMVELARTYAKQIDEADDAKVIGWLGQNLVGALKALGGTPAERKALGVETQVRGKLAALRQERSG